MPVLSAVDIFFAKSSTLQSTTLHIVMRVSLRFFSVYFFSIIVYYTVAKHDNKQLQLQTSKRNMKKRLASHDSSPALWLPLFPRKTASRQPQLFRCLNSTGIVCVSFNTFQLQRNKILLCEIRLLFASIDHRTVHKPITEIQNMYFSSIHLRHFTEKFLFCMCEYFHHEMTCAEYYTLLIEIKQMLC